MSSLFSELKRRNVFRVAVLYAVTGWLVMQIADVVIPYFGIPDWTFRFIVVLFALGFVPALIFSWAYELTPEGIKRESEIDRTQSITPSTGRRIDSLIVGLLVVLIGLVAMNRFMPREAPAGPAFPGPVEIQAERPGQPAIAAMGQSEDPSAVDPHSIAVLPFFNMSDDPQQEFFSDGLAESLLHLLAQVKDLRVAARTSSFQFKGHTGGIDEIGEILNVANVLEGSVRRAGDTIRVTAQLIKVDDGFNLWSGTYDRTLDDVFAIQDEIAQQVAEALKVALLGEDSRQTTAASTSIEAYDEYLLGRQQLNIDSFESMSAALGHFQKAVELDEAFIPAWVGQAETWYRMGNTGVIARSEMFQNMDQLCERIIRMDPGNAEARALLATSDFLQHFPSGSGVAEREFRLARELAPRDPLVLGEYARFLGYNGENPMPVLELALSIDPLSASLMSRTSMTATRYNMFDIAIRWGERLKAVHPGNPNANWALSRAYWNKGDLVRAVRSGRRMLIDDPDDFEGPASLAAILLDLGLLDAAREEVQKSESMGPGRPMPAYARIAFEYRMGNLGRSGELALSALNGRIDARHWGPGLILTIAADHGLRTGQIDASLAAMRVWLEFDDPAAVDDWFGYLSQMALLPLIRASGDSVTADGIQRNARAFLARTDPALLPGLATVNLEIDAGNHDAAISEFERLVDQGLHVRWWLITDRFIEPIKDDPRVVAARQRQQAELARMRDEVAQELTATPLPAIADSDR